MHRAHSLLAAIVVAAAGCRDSVPTEVIAPSSGVAAAKGSGSGGGSTPTPPPAPGGGGAPNVASVVVSPSITVQGVTSGFVVGGTTGTGTVTLTAVASAATTVSLVSDNSFVMPVPATVTVPAGQRSATFPVGSLPVRGTFTLNISAGVATISANARVYVAPSANTDIITLPTLTLNPKRTSPQLGEVRVQATSTNPNATLTAYFAGSPVATLTNNGGGRFSATFLIPALDTDIEVRSQTNGCGVRGTNRLTPSRSCPSL